MQGGLGGILNNVEGLLVKAPALAGIATIAATGFYLAWPSIKKWFDDFRSEADAAGGAFGTMQDRLDAIGKKIDEIKGKKYPDAKDIAEHNRLLGERVQLEKEIAAEKKLQADYQKIVDRSTEAAIDQAKSGETARREAALAKMPLGQVMGVRRDLIAGLEQTAGVPGLAAEEAGLRGTLTDPANALKFTPAERATMERRRNAIAAQIAAVRGAIPGKAEEIVGGMAGGGRAGLDRVLAALPRDSASYEALSKLSGEGMTAEARADRDQRFRNVGELVRGLGRHALDKAGEEGNKRARAAAAKAAKDRERESEKALGEIGPGVPEFEQTIRANEAAAARAPHEAAAAARAREQAALEARRRAAAARVERSEGVRMPPAEALQYLEGQRRHAQQEQLDRNRELRTAEAIYQAGGQGYEYNVNAPTDQLRRENNQLKAGMSEFVRATVEASAANMSMIGDLRAGAQFLRGQVGQMNQNGAPGVSGGKP